MGQLSNVVFMNKVKVKKILISVFCCLNLLTVFFMNRMPAVTKWSNQIIDTNLNSLNAWRLGNISWYIQRYAHLAGLDNRWEMFSYAHRFNWNYVFIAKYSDATSVVLPLPLQSERGFFQSKFVDFREAKFYLNVYGNRDARMAYAQYLCRQYAQAGSAKIQSILLELHHQGFLEREQAILKNDYLEPASHTQPLDTFPCS